MKKHPTKRNNHAAAGGTLKTQLDELIASLRIDSEPAARRLPRRVRCGIEALRRYICAELGVKTEQVTNWHVASLARRIGWGFLYDKHFHGIGMDTLEELHDWADDVFAGRETA